ncbi:hypothetical protein DsansV1_C07g0071881 [Dioscorea sansibarensis]
MRPSVQGLERIRRLLLHQVIRQFGSRLIKLLAFLKLQRRVRGASLKDVLLDFVAAGFVKPAAHSFRWTEDGKLTISEEL